MRERKKVVQLIHELNTGGAETLVKEYALHLDRYKYDVCVLCYKHIPTPYDAILKNAGIRVIYTDDYWKPRLSGAAGRALERIYRYIAVRIWLKRLKPDIVHAHLSTNRLLAFAGLGKNVNVFYTVHSDPAKYWTDEKTANKDEFRAAKRNVTKYGMRFITLHENMKREVNALFQVNNSIVLNNGIDFSRFNINISKVDERKILGIPLDAFVVGHVGRFSEPKNHRFLVEAFSNVIKEKPEAFLLMVGSGKLKSEIERRLSELGLDGKYKILERRSDIPEILAAMDVFVFPSLWEGMGISLIEAQKSGLMCVISENIPKEARVSNLVRVVKGYNADMWADAILNNSIEHIEYYDIEQWSIENTVEKLDKIYERLV